jgi:FkbM family methyltransferase
MIDNELNLDFLEIGTSDYETCIQGCVEDEVGISVEPLKFYLDKLPNKKNVIKVNSAISKNNEYGSVDLYYIPSEVIESNGLAFWFKGCNRIGGYHPVHIRHKVTHLVKKEKVNLIPISELLTKYKVKKIKFLKVDIEGLDCYILRNLLDYLKDKSFDYYPDSILFESNENTEKQFLQSTIQLFKDLNYTVVFSNQDTLLKKSQIL